MKVFRTVSVLTVTVLLSLTPIVSVGQAFAAENANPTDSSYSTLLAERSAGTAEIISADTMRLHLAPGASVDVMEATITQNGVTEELPVRATDRNGHPVWVTYSKASNGDILVKISSMGGERVWWKCVLGTAGGAIAGGTTGGLTGAAVGSVELPVVGTVSGAIVGIIGGGIGGGMAGAGASC